MDISVVIPCYNCAGTIEKTLESIFNQIYPCKEIIAVNDGSKDETEQVLEKYKDRVTCITQENSGVSKTRNRGVSAACSEWVAFCDADDIWHPAKLLALSESIESRLEADFVFHDYYITRNDEVIAERGTHSKHSLFPIFKYHDIKMGDILKDHRGVIFDENFDLEWESFNTYYGNALYWLIMGNFVLPSSVAIRKNVFEKYNGFDDSFIHAEDTEFFLRISKHVNFMYMDIPLVGYRRAEGSLLLTSMLPTMINGLKSTIKHCVEDKEVYDKYKVRIQKSVGRKYARLAYFYLTEFKKKDAFVNAMQALKFSPFTLLPIAVMIACLLPTSVLKMMRNAKSRIL